MTDTIPPTPEVPPGLRDAAQLTKPIPFVGAGASKLAGCPDWNEFADEALRVFVEHGKFSHAQPDQVKTLNPRVKLSIALALQAEHHIQIDFRRILHRKERTEHAIGCRLYSYLSKLGKTFVTTNYDEWLDEEIVPPTTDVGAAGGRQRGCSTTGPDGLFQARRHTPCGGELFDGANLPDQRFAGLFRDGAAGLDYAQARSYHVRTGRFNAPDPVYAVRTPAAPLPSPAAARASPRTAGPPRRRPSGTRPR